MRRLGLAAFAALLACSGRPQSSGDGQVASPSDAGAPAADGSTSSSGACPEPAPLALHTSARGDFVVALPHDAHTSELALPSPRSGEAAMLVDYPPSDVAGFVLSRATSLGSVDDDAQAALRRVTDAVAALDGLVIVRAAGYHAPSHEQHETHLGVLLDIVAPARRASDLRATLIAALLSRSPPQLASLPAAFGDVSARQTVRLSLSRRGPSVLLAGAVTPTARYDDAYRPNGVLVDDLTSMLAVARAGSHLARGACLTYQIWQPATDVLLVVDSSSLLAHRDEIGAHAATIALQAQQHDAVTRIAVVSAPRRGQAPVLCRGRFFGPSEAGAIRGCALDAARAPAAPPPRDPLEAAVRVLEALAPAPAPRWQREHHRLVDEPTRIRRGASVSMVLFTTRSSLTPRPPR
ncbi:MAG: hypothetical protein KC503_16605, partial [Myxococcales bacterium]|nr:hypothetical protein [Myxococcales bacterium]